MDTYDPQAIETKWQQLWESENAFHTPNATLLQLIRQTFQHTQRRIGPFGFSAVRIFPA